MKESYEILVELPVKFEVKAEVEVKENADFVVKASEQKMGVKD